MRVSSSFFPTTNDYQPWGADSAVMPSGELDVNFKSFTIRHTVQRKTSSFSGQRTSDPQVEHLPAVRSRLACDAGPDPSRGPPAVLRLGRIPGFLGQSGDFACLLAPSSSNYCAQKGRLNTSTALEDDVERFEGCLAASAKWSQDYARSIPRGMHPRPQYIVLRLLVC